MSLRQSRYGHMCPSGSKRVNATFSNISVISLWSVFLMEETKYPEKTTYLSQFTDKLYHTSPWTGSNSQLWWWYALIAHVVINPTTIRPRLHHVVHEVSQRSVILYMNVNATFHFYWTVLLQLYNLIWYEYCNLIGWFAWSNILVILYNLGWYCDVANEKFK